MYVKADARLQPVNLLCRLPAECRRDADRLQRALGWRDGHPAIRHQLADEGCRLWPLDCRLHADADETFGVVERLEGQARYRGSRNVRVAAAAIAKIEFRATVDQQLHDIGT